MAGVSLEEALEIVREIETRLHEMEILHGIVKRHASIIREHLQRLEDRSTRLAINGKRKKCDITRP